MAQHSNPALTALRLVLEDAAERSGTSIDDLIVLNLEFRQRGADPGPLPPAFFITLGNGMEYIADTQGNITPPDIPGRDLTDRELRVRFSQTGGFAGQTLTYEATDETLSDQEAEQLRQFLTDTDFFNLPDEVSNGDPIPDLYTYTIWIAHGRRNRELTTYDGKGPHGNPPLAELVIWLSDRASAQGGPADPVHPAPANGTDQSVLPCTGSHSAIRALSASLGDVANRLRVPVDQVSVVSLEAREWPDSCLGLGTDDEGCAEAIEPGYHVALGDGFSYRSDLRGNIRPETDTMDHELVIVFKQSGGIGGWSSEYRADESTLTAEESRQVIEFIERMDFFGLPAEVENGQPIADLFDYTLTLAHGRRHHTIHTYDGGGPPQSPALVEFIGWLQERAPSPGPTIQIDQS